MGESIDPADPTDEADVMGWSQDDQLETDDPQEADGAENSSVLADVGSFVPMSHLVRRGIEDLVESFDAGVRRRGGELPSARWSVPLADWERGVLNLVHEGLKETGDKRGTPEGLGADDAALLLSLVRPVVRIAPQGTSTDDALDMLAVYDPAEGIYDVSDDGVARMVDEVAPRLGGMQALDVTRKLRRRVPRVVRCQDPALVAVANGVFDCRTGRMRAFDPSLVFTSKTQVAYVEDPQNPVLQHPDGTSWDVESWMASLSDDPEVVQLLWEITHAAVRPTAGWDKVAFLYSERGNNGKGTFCRMLRNLLGPASVTSIPVSEFGKDFSLTPLAKVSTIVTDENDVGTFTEKMATWKAVTTGDAFLLNRKHRDPVVLQFTGFQVQCFNELPKFRDRSPSLTRRILLVPMTKCFTGVERKEIKSDFLGRREVLEYVLHRVLHMQVTQLSNPQAARQLMSEFRTDNDPVRDFWLETGHRLVWHAVPLTFLYELYGAWMRRTNPGGRVVKQRTFTNQLREVVEEVDGDLWEYKASVRPGAKGRMAAPEPMVLELTDLPMARWGQYDQRYTGRDQLASRLGGQGAQDAESWEVLAGRMNHSVVTPCLVRAEDDSTAS